MNNSTTNTASTSNNNTLFSFANYQPQLQNIPQLSKILAISLVGLYLFGLLVPGSIEVFALIPGYTIPPHFYIWNIITSGYFEISLLNAAISCIGVIAFGRYLEPIWGPKEYIRFITIINACCGLATFVLMFILFFILRSDTLWFDSRLCGFSGVISGFTVALKQLVPDQEIKLLFAFHIRAKHLATILLLMNCGIFLLGLPSSESFSFTVFGVIFSWIYLRFFQVKAGIVGDMSEQFSLASFFPEPVQPIVKVISKITFNVLRACNCCNHLTLVPSDSSSIYTTDSMDSERRKARALRTLDQRIQLAQDFHMNHQAVQADILPNHHYHQGNREIPEV